MGDPTPESRPGQSVIRVLGRAVTEEPEMEVEVVDETAEEALCREIMEEPVDEIRVNVKLRYNLPVEFITVRLDAGDEAGE